MSSLPLSDNGPPSPPCTLVGTDGIPFQDYEITVTSRLITLAMDWGSGLDYNCSLSKRC